MLIQQNPRGALGLTEAHNYRTGLTKWHSQFGDKGQNRDAAVTEGLSLENWETQAFLNSRMVQSSQPAAPPQPGLFIQPVRRDLEDKHTELITRVRTLKQKKRLH